MPDRWAPLQQLLEAGVSQGVFTAAVALVGLKGELRWEGAAGALSREPGAAAVTLDTVFDLASLTKPLATTLALMVLAARGQLKVDRLPGGGPPGPLAAAGQASPDPGEPPHPPLRAAGLAPFLPGSSGRARPGPPWPFGAPGRGHAPVARPGHRNGLQRPGLHAAKAVVENLSGETLDRFCREEIYRPLGLKTLGFIPLPNRPKRFRHRTEPKTESAFMPPPSRASSRDAPPEAKSTTKTPGPPAGWRATPASSAPAGRSFVWWPAFVGLIAEKRPAPSPRRRSSSFSRSPPGLTGPWASISPARTRPSGPPGAYFSPHSVGHLGFTGTSFWLDLDSGQMVVLLTNRVHLGRDDKTKIQAFRPRFHEAASRALGF